MKVIFSVVLIVVLISSVSFAQEEGEGPLADLTTDELADMIESRLAGRSEVIKFIPGLTILEDIDGQPYYKYTTVDGKTEELGELDKKTLEMIFLKVTNEMNRLNNERLQLQLKQMRQAQHGVPKPPPQPPKAYTPPQIPQPPKVYTPPNIPQPPARRNNQ